MIIGCEATSQLTRGKDLNTQWLVLNLHKVEIVLKKYVESKLPPDTRLLSTMMSVHVGRSLFAAPRRAARTAARRELSTLLTAVEEYPG